MQSEDTTRLPLSLLLNPLHILPTKTYDLSFVEVMGKSVTNRLTDGNTETPQLRVKQFAYVLVCK